MDKEQIRFQLERLSAHANEAITELDKEPNPFLDGILLQTMMDCDMHIRNIRMLATFGNPTERETENEC